MRLSQGRGTAYRTIKSDTSFTQHGGQDSSKPSEAHKQRVFIVTANKVCNAKQVYSDGGQFRGLEPIGKALTSGGRFRRMGRKARFQGVLSKSRKNSFLRDRAGERKYPIRRRWHDCCTMTNA